MYVPIGGIEQWIQIGGGDPANPVLLFLHGGPGGTSWPAAVAWKPWEEHFTLARMVEDGIEVAEFLRSRLKAGRILLVGHSWGSILGLHMVKRRPDLFSAHVGASQSINIAKAEEIARRRLLQRAEQSGNAEALHALAGLGAPPYGDRDRFLAFRQWMDKLATTSIDGIQPRPVPRNPELDEEAAGWIQRGAQYSRARLFPELLTIDVRTLGTTFERPIYFFMGSEDLVTPQELAEDYLATIRAPQKGLVRFEGCHHFFVMNQPDWFLRELLAHVRPHI